MVLRMAIVRATPRCSESSCLGWVKISGAMPSWPNRPHAKRLLVRSNAVVLAGEMQDFFRAGPGHQELNGMALARQPHILDAGEFSLDDRLVRAGDRSREGVAYKRGHANLFPPRLAVRVRSPGGTGGEGLRVCLD